MEIGVVLDILWPLERIERLARAAEESGFDQVWVSDHPLGADPFLTIAHLARLLPRIRLGLGTVNPSARHPAVIAASAGFLNHLIGGRLSLGVGSSINPLLRPIGLEVEGQIPRCREAIRIIRALLETGSTTLDGEVFSTHDAKARFEGCEPIQVLVGASGGPAMLRMSGEEAHGVIIPAGNRGFYQYAIDSFHRARGDVEMENSGAIVVNGNIAVSDDSREALDIIRPLVADAIAHRAENKHSLAHMGITLHEARAWRDNPALVPEHVVRDSAIAGTPKECVDGLLSFAEWGITQLSIRFPEESTIREVGTKVLPVLRKEL
jgi:5,10-methylenetetrahydromethanopterin reductase